MIDFYYWPTPNGWKVSIMLEECGLDYQMKPVNIGKGEQFEPAFLSISPNNRMPTITDHDTGGEPVSVFESGAILLYLAEKTKGDAGMAVLANQQPGTHGRSTQSFRQLCARRSSLLAGTLRERIRPLSRRTRTQTCRTRIYR